MVKAAKEIFAYEKGEANDLRVSRYPLTVREAAAAPPPELSKEQIAEIRNTMNFSQAVFASVLNVAPATVRAWEQGNRRPDGASLRLLQIAKDSPQSIRAYLYKGK